MNTLIQRIRFTKEGMEIETQEGDKIVEKFLVSWKVLRAAFNKDVAEYLQYGDRPSYHRYGEEAPKAVFEFPLEIT